MTPMKVARIVKQISSAIPAFFQASIPSCESIPAQHMQMSYTRGRFYDFKMGAALAMISNGGHII